MKRTFIAALVCLLPVTANAGGIDRDDAEVMWPFQSTAAVPCDNTLRTQTYHVHRKLRIKKVFIWQGLGQHKASDVTMNIHSASKGQNFIIAGHDDYTNGADRGRQFTEDFGGLYYTVPAGDVLTFTYGCTKNPRRDIPAHYMGFIVGFVVAG